MRHADILRLQVVALRDVPAHEVIPANAVALKWTPYEPDTLTRLEQVAGRTVRQAIREGHVIHAGSMDIRHYLVRQVVVKTPAGFAPFEVIRAGDVTLKEAAYEPGSFDWSTELSVAM